ncbi:hypothetical protein EDB82DRAFT_521710 [Fusarium venenatum]|uniref:uncharacterized protein n=1 Tax=Fusarium venenatum TaxID=56646 RepID=UPI001D4542C5|nr:hypothetical protein EDB82DRAFT_521710 [Fusarium venenatum]
MLEFISEPEAAALATIKDMGKISTVKTEDTIVVCDAGGGTVDLISYVFESTDPFIVKECVKGDGDLCGGVFLDEAFMKLIKNKTPTILQSNGSKPWTAIYRGAVVQGLLRHNPPSGLGVVVESRIARMSYGVMYRTPFVPGKHKKNDQVWCAMEQLWMANNQMGWFLQERSVHHDYYRLIDGAMVKISNEIFCSTTFPSPRRYDGTNGIRSLCNISWDQKVKTSSLPTFTNDNNQCFPKLGYRIKMECDDRIVNFAVYFNG